MKTPLKLLAALALLCFLTSGMALAGKVKDEPGYIDLDWIEIPDNAAEVQDIDLSDILKSVAADAKDSGDDELSQILVMVRSIRVKGFSVEKGDTKKADKAVKKVTALLKDKDWKRLIYLKDDEEVMSVSTKYDGDDLVGLMMIAYEPGEEVMFANVVGDLDLPAIMALVGAMDGDELDDLLEGLDDMDGVHVHVDDD